MHTSLLPRKKEFQRRYIFISTFDVFFYFLACCDVRSCEEKATQTMRMHLEIYPQTKNKISFASLTEVRQIILFSVPFFLVSRMNFQLAISFSFEVSTYFLLYVIICSACFALTWHKFILQCIILNIYKWKGIKEFFLLFLKFFSVTFIMSLSMCIFIITILISTLRKISNE